MPPVDFTDSVLALGDVEVGVHEALADGPTFVLVHGLGVSSSYFRPLAEQLVGLGRVVALDLPGSGDTARPPRPLTIQDLAAVVLEAFAALQITEPVVLGHSMGTQVVVEALARASGLARGAVLASPIVDNEERRTGRVLWRFARSARHEPFLSAVEAVRAYASCAPRSVIGAWPSMLGFRIEQRISDVDCDVTLVGGGLDSLCTRPWLDLLRSRTRRPEQTEILWFDDAAHQVTWSHPEACRRAMVELADRPR